MTLSFENLHPHESEPVNPGQFAGHERDFLITEGVPEHVKQGTIEERTGKKKRLATVLLATLIAFNATEESFAATSSAIAETPPAPEYTIDVDKAEEEYRKNYKEFSEVVEKRSIKKKISFLEDFFGGAVSETFFSMRKVDWDVEQLEKLEGAEEWEGVFIKEDVPLASTLGSRVSSAYEKRWRPETKELTDASLALDGVEAVEGFDNDRFEEFLSKYPRQYLLGSLRGVEFIPERQTDGKNIVLGKAESFGLSTLLRDDSRVKVTIFEDQDGTTFEDFINVFEHELHHTQDWESSTVLTSAERVEMLSDIAARINAEDRFISPYVEGINADDAERRRASGLPANTSETQMLHYVKAKEYWAEIAKAYFDNPASLLKNHSRDYEIVERWVTTMSSRVRLP